MTQKTSISVAVLSALAVVFVMGWSGMVARAEVLAAKDRSSMTLRIDFTEQKRSEADQRLTSMEIAFAGDQRCSSIRSRRGGASDDVTVCRVGGTDAEPIIVLNIERVEEVPRGIESKKLEASTKLGGNKPSPVGVFVYGDGASTSISARLLGR